MADPPQDIDTEELAEAVVDQLDPGSVINDKVILSRRQLLALTGGGAGLAALGFGSGTAAAANGTNDTSVGDVGAAGDSVDVYVDELRDDAGDEWLDVDDTGDINATFGRTWNYDSISTNDGSIGGDPILGGPSASQDAGVSLGGGYQTVDPDNPVLLTVRLSAETDGTTNGQINLDVDESGNSGPSDYTLRVFVDNTNGSGVGGQESFTIYLPPGGQVNPDNVADPNNANSLNVDQAVVL